MFKVGAGVRIRGIAPELVLALVVADQVYSEVAQENLVVTSVNDSEHSRTSLHYMGCAADLRTNNIAAGRRPIVADTLRRRLEPLGDFDVVLEKDHIHLEFQPKGVAG